MSKLLSKEIINFLELRGNVYQGHYFYNGVRRPRIRFVISNVDEKFLLRVKEELGYGSVCYNNRSYTYLYTIGASSDVYDFILKMKKYLSPERISQFTTAYEIYTDKVKNTEYVYANRR